MSPKRRQNNQGKKSVEPAQNAQEGTWVYVDKSSDSFFNVYKALQDWQRELIVRKWMKANKLFWGSEETLLNSFFVHMFALCRQPAGRAEAMANEVRSSACSRCHFRMSCVFLC